MVGEKPERERGGTSNLEFTPFNSCRGRTKHVRKGDIAIRVLNVHSLENKSPEGKEGAI